MHRLLARLTGQDLREQLAQVNHRLHRNTRAIEYLNGAINRARIQLSNLESQMSELDTTTDGIVAALDDLITAVGTGPTDLANALAEIQAKNAQIAELQADDDADAEQITTLLAERDQLVTDSVENVARLQAATARAREVVPAAEPAPVDPEAPVETAGGNA